MSNMKGSPHPPTPEVCSQNGPKGQVNNFDNGNRCGESCPGRGVGAPRCWVGRLVVCVALRLLQLLVTCPEHFALSALGLGVSCQGVQQSLLRPESCAWGCAQFGGGDFGVPGAWTTDGARGAVDKSPGIAA